MANAFPALECVFFTSLKDVISNKKVIDNCINYWVLPILTSGGPNTNKTVDEWVI